MKIHVSIVDYLKAPRVESVLDAIERQTLSKKINTTIIDNSVCDRNFDTLKRRASKSKSVTLIKAANNIGYIKATNLTVDLSADYLVIINPDVVMQSEDCIEKCITAMECSPDIGI